MNSNTRAWKNLSPIGNDFYNGTLEFACPVCLADVGQACSCFNDGGAENLTVHEERYRLFRHQAGLSEVVVDSYIHKERPAALIDEDSDLFKPFVEPTNDELKKEIIRLNHELKMSTNEALEAQLKEAWDEMDNYKHKVADEIATYVESSSESKEVLPQVIREKWGRKPG